ncbi:hypothetical protein ACJX0J_031617 [Zea mays]
MALDVDNHRSFCDLQSWAQCLVTIDMNYSLNDLKLHPLQHITNLVYISTCFVYSGKIIISQSNIDFKCFFVSNQQVYFSFLSTWLIATVIDAINSEENKLVHDCIILSIMIKVENITSKSWEKPIPNLMIDSFGDCKDAIVIKTYIKMLTFCQNLLLWKTLAHVIELLWPLIIFYNISSIATEIIDAEYSSIERIDMIVQLIRITL